MGAIVKLGAAAALLMIPAAAPAYDIKAKQSVHESITRAALICAKAAGASGPVDCKADFRQIRSTAAFSRSWFTNFNRLETSVRWPDDPLRSLYSPGGTLGFAAKTLFGGCEAGNSEERLAVVYERGFLCGSHYGRLQFLHAMAVPDEEADIELTRAKILDWSMFAYRVATARAPLEESYCRYVRGQAGAAAEELAPKDFPFCDEAGNDSWKVKTLFSLKCWLPTTRFGCTEYSWDVRARRAAAGAFLHAIQDSYSQSHARRGPAAPDDAFVARADCAFPSAFYAYTPANRRHHSDADKPPELGENCGIEGAAADVVTASAIAIWHLCRNSDPKAVRTFLETRVFGPSAPDKRPIQASNDLPGSAAPFPTQCAALL
jgi:hypothetical protein